MKAFISVDLEGMPYIVSVGHLNLKGPLYAEARTIATKVILIVADELHQNGFDKVVIADSHGPMVNLHIDDLPEYVDIVRGYPRPLSMVAGVEDCDAAVFLGYHAKYGTARSSFDHTYNGASINKVEVNGAMASEFMLNGYVAGECKVPIIMVAGEAQLLKDDVAKFAPWAQTVALKHSLSRVSARSPSMIQLQKDLRKAVAKAARDLKNKKTKPLIAKKPVNMAVTFLACQYADVASLLPFVKRIDGLKIEFEAENMMEAYKTFELLCLAAGGISSIIESQR
jgi:D-amino peptidase